MTRAEIEKSLALWEERETRYYQQWRWHVEHSAKTSPGRAKRYNQYKHARFNVNRRKAQLAKLPLKISAKGLGFIKAFEGFPNGGKPYLDPVGVWTRGYGRIEGIGPNSPRISEPAAARELEHLIERSYAPTIRRLGIPLKQHQFDALTSFVYNVGIGGVSSSTGVGRGLRAKNFTAAMDSLLLWNKGGGRVLPGLDRRRKSERDMFLNGDFTPR